MAIHPKTVLCATCKAPFVTRCAARIFCSIECNLLSRLEKIKHGLSEDDCWEWSGASLVSGYGKLNYCGAQELAHRVSYRASKGAIPPGMVICHTCDNKKCLNPSHLFVGTLADNNRDCINKNRHVVGRIGQEHSMAKLTESEVIEILQLIRSKVMTQRAIAAAYGVSAPAITLIAKGKNWSHLPRDF